MMIRYALMFCAASVLPVQAQVVTAGNTGHQSFQWVNTRPERPAEIVYYANAYADHYRVPRELVYAIITQESGWKPWVVSSKGAMGLMQLMPSIAEQYGVTNPFDISQNLSGGVHYLADLLAKFSDWRLAVASYNCGPLYPLKQGLAYSNPDVIAYVRAVQKHYFHELLTTALNKQPQEVTTP